MHKKLFRDNYFVSLAFLLVLIILLIIMAFILVTAFPGILATPPPDYETREYYEFEPWSFAINGSRFSFPEGGIIVPLYKDNRQAAALLCSDHFYYNNQSSISGGFSGVFLVTTEEHFEDIRGNIIFAPVGSYTRQLQAKAIIENQIGLPRIWKIAIPVVFQPQGKASYHYLINLEREPLLPPVVHDSPFKPLFSVVLYLIILLIILLTIMVLTLDHRPSRYCSFLYQQRPAAAGLLLVPLVALIALGGELFTALGNRPDYFVVSGYAICIAILVLLARRQVIDYLDFGLYPDSFKRGYLVVAASTVMVAVVFMARPQGLNLNTYSALTFLKLFFLVALARELIWRGFIQVTLSRRFGITAGLWITVLIAGLGHLAQVYILEPWIYGYPYAIVELCVLVPGSALVLGVLFNRTENILSCALLHTLILFLPTVILT